MYSGLIIKESIQDEKILDEIEIVTMIFLSKFPENKVFSFITSSFAGFKNTNQAVLFLPLIPCIFCIQTSFLLYFQDGILKQHP